MIIHPSKADLKPRPYQDQEIDFESSSGKNIDSITMHKDGKRYHYSYTNGKKELKIYYFHQEEPKAPGFDYKAPGFGYIKAGFSSIKDSIKERNMTPKEKEEFEKAALTLSSKAGKGAKALVLDGLLIKLKQ